MATDRFEGISTRSEGEEPFRRIMTDPRLARVAKVLETLGLSKSAAVDTVRRFRVHDEATMAKQQAVKDDENKFMQTTRESAEQLLHLFETDAAQPEEPAA